MQTKGHLAAWQQGLLPPGRATITKGIGFTLILHRQREEFVNFVS